MGINHWMYIAEQQMMAVPKKVTNKQSHKQAEKHENIQVNN